MTLLTYSDVLITLRLDGLGCRECAPCGRTADARPGLLLTVPGRGRRRERPDQRVRPVVVTRFGGPALAALREMLAHVRDGDPMTAVDVAVAAAFAGISVRRRFANPGLVGVRFAPLPRLIADRALLMRLRRCGAERVTAYGPDAFARTVASAVRLASQSHAPTVDIGRKL